jgi:hypothetical protein
MSYISSVSSPPSDTYSKLREGAAVALLKEIGQTLFRISATESGRLAETCFQVLSESKFKALMTIIVGQETDDVSRQLLFSIAVQIACKLGITINEEQATEGAASILALLNSENLRRKGYMEYVWVNDIFTDAPSHPGFTRLTESGTQLAQKQLLEQYKGGKYIN